ncbi:glutamate--tRNA ligase [bacterium TMED181]|nr:glutamate--tRNA ligase [Planctomycetota bacterium]OUW47090.1 MAG: glutamate--tRNA ligase [bacterium TMED181]
MSSQKTPRVRIAPSPTGDPHVGTAYVALFNRTHALQGGGQFLLRIDDTDRSRYQETSEEQIFTALRWLGLVWDEGPDCGGPHAPYRQSERLDHYRECIDRMMQSGHAYPCFCTEERIGALRQSQKEAKQRLGYDGECRDLDPEESKIRMEKGETHVIRLKVPDHGETSFQDALRGEVQIANAEIDDQILIKSDGFPTYHLANVADDIAFGITDVIRAEEWLISTPKHVLIYQALGEELPRFLHVSLLRNADKSKISKRKNPVSLDWFRQEGFLPEALLNFLALMGWSPEDENEVFDMDTFQKNFRIENLSTGAPIFDMTKLDWLNGMHIRRLEIEDLASRLISEGFVPTGIERQEILRILPLVIERMNRLSEFADKTDWFFSEPKAPPLEDLIPKKSTGETSLAALGAAANELQKLDVFDTPSIEECLNGVLEVGGWKKPFLFMPLRFALTSRRDSPDLIEVISILGKERSCQRIQSSMKTLSES